MFKKVVNHQVWLDLAELCLTMAIEDENSLVTEHTLLKLANNDAKINSNRQLKTEKFFLLITPKYNALFRREKIAQKQNYRVTVAFDRATIVRELIQLSHQNKWSIAVIKHLKTDVIANLSQNSDNSAEFALKAIKLLIEDEPTKHNHSIYEVNPSLVSTAKWLKSSSKMTFLAKQGARGIHSTHSTPPMEKLLQYQVEQERIFERIKIQISQNLDLSEIIQTAIDHSCSFLELDRLLIYQLDVPSKSYINDLESVKTIDTITYEAKGNDKIASTLYFQEENCWQKHPQNKNKYYQGFCLVIDDLEDFHLNPCLQSMMAKLQVKAKAVIPINVQGKLWGFIIAHQCFKPRQWHHQDIQFLRQMAEYLAIAIFHHQSYQQLQQQKLLLEKQVQTQAQQLKDALIAAEAASKSKHDFLGSMSHELRTPLTCVIGLSSTLLQWSSAKKSISLSPEKQQEYLHLIKQSGNHLLTLINNILEFSDVDSGKHLLDVRQISLTKIVRQSTELLRETALAKQITLNCEVRLEPEQDYFLADEVRLKEIIFHLLNNGIKFTSEGKVTLRIWREKRQVIFQVEDTGIGIAAEEIPTLFEQFRQIENFRQRTQGGAGLGLALTKKLVELHGGRIEVESALEQGSVFTVYLPEKTPFKPSLNLEPAKSSPASLGSKTIMLITEDEESATFIRQLLNTLEYQVVWLMDSTVAIEQIELLQPKIVIVDRDYSTADLRSIIKAIARTPLANKINLALLGDRFDLHEWHIECGIDDYLLKSMNPAQIINKINSLIEGKAGHSQIRNEQSDKAG